MIKNCKNLTYDTGSYTCDYCYELSTCCNIECPDIDVLNNMESTNTFTNITNEMYELCQIKNKNYGDSFSKQFEEYGLTSVCIRLGDKINRLKSLNKQILDSDNGITQVNTQDESVRDTLIDLANYSVLAIMELDK